MLQDVLYLFQFISYSGASTLIIPAGSDSVETAPSSKGIRALRVMQKATCLAIFLLLLGVSVFEIWKFAIVFSKMDNIAEVSLNDSNLFFHVYKYVFRRNKNKKHFYMLADNQQRNLVDTIPAGCSLSTFLRHQPVGVV